MKIEQVQQLCALCKKVGIETWGQLQRFKDKCTDGTNSDTMDKLSGCAAHGINYSRGLI